MNKRGPYKKKYARSILGLLLEGMSQSQVARELSISRNTVCNYIAKLRDDAGSMARPESRRVMARALLLQLEQELGKNSAE